MSHAANVQTRNQSSARPAPVENALMYPCLQKACFEEILHWTTIEPDLLQSEISQEHKTECDYKGGDTTQRLHDNPTGLLETGWQELFDW